MFQNLMQGRYLNILKNPLDLLRTKKLLQVNPTIPATRKEPDHIKIFVYEYNAAEVEEREIKTLSECYQFFESTKFSWINIDGLRQTEIENIGNHFGIHPLIIEDILSFGQRPKMDELNGLLFCLLNMLYFNSDNNSVETEQISIVLGKNFVISFQEDETKDVFNPLRGKIKIAGSKLRQSGVDYLFYSLIDMIVDNYFVVMEKLGKKLNYLRRILAGMLTREPLPKLIRCEKK